MKPAGTRTRLRTALAAAALALACTACPALARENPGPQSAPATGPGSPLRQGNRVVAEVRFDHGALAGIDDLRAAGARVLAGSRRYQTVTVAVRPGRLGALNRVDRVEAATPVPTPVAYGTCGLVNSEGDTQLGAAEARNDFGVDGTGVKVGILSDSFDADSKAPTHAAGDVASGDLPGAGNPCGFTAPVNLLDDFLSPKSSDEGRGMAQIVHDLAPGAGISFASAFLGEVAYAENIRGLAAAGASVIVDDVAYFEEPFFQDGPIAAAIDEVVGKGVAYFSAAGNDNLFEEEPLGSGKFNDNEIASWEAPSFRDAGECPTALKLVAETEKCLDFDPSGGGEDTTFGIRVDEDEELTIDLQWAEPWNGVKADIDAYLLDEAGVSLLNGLDLVDSTSNNVAQPDSAVCNLQPVSLRQRCQRPVELITWKNNGPETEVQLVVNRCFSKTPKEAEEEKGCNPGADPTVKPRIKLILPQNGKGVTATEYHQSKGGDVVGPAIYGHAGAPAAFSTGAIRVGNFSEPEFFSSRGPVKHYFGPVTGAAAAAPLEQTISKPNAVASDCGRTTFFVRNEKTPGIYRFCGTSAAAPHAAAIAALARQANPSLSPAQIGAGLAATARPVGGFGPDAVGAGLLDAHRMLEDVALPPVITIVNPPRPVSNNRSPSIGFTANRPVSFACSLDAAHPTPCTSPFTPPVPLADGLHGFAVRGEDLAGRVGISRTVTFVVDTVAPRTSFRGKPRRVLRTRTRRARAVFRLASNEPGSTFTCRVDGGLVRFCPPRVARRFGVGRHVMRAMAVDAAGNVDKTPATFRFKVKQVGRGSHG